MSLVVLLLVSVGKLGPSTFNPSNSGSVRWHPCRKGSPNFNILTDLYIHYLLQRSLSGDLSVIFEWIEFCEILDTRPLLIDKLPELHYTIQ
jgi:hypothetical protein